MGIKPWSPGMDQVSLRYWASSLEDIVGTVPSPHGSLSVAWFIPSQKKASLRVEVAEGMQAYLDVTSLPRRENFPLLINGTRFTGQRNDLTAYWRWEGGKHVIEFQPANSSLGLACIFLLTVINSSDEALVISQLDSLAFARLYRGATALFCLEKVPNKRNDVHFHD